MTKKPILCLDFDGVIHSYTSGWHGANIVPDPPVPGALEFILEAVEHFNVHIYSSRSGQPGGIPAMQTWLYVNLNKFLKPDPMKIDEVIKAKIVVSDEIKWPTEKPPAMVTIDDRAITFTGEWPDMETLKSFKPWNKAD